ncbi:MAG: 3,8-cyclase MoaA [Verrucomicrobiota bacterium]
MPSPLPLPEPHTDSHPPLRDRLGRPLRDLRLSLTDRCNLRCPYCMPREVFGPEHPFLPESELLSFPEMLRLAEAFLACGVRKIRLTGGEPLLRPGLISLVEQLSRLPLLEDLALTTNGTALASLAPALKSAGLHRITVSLDALDPATFQRMSDSRVRVERVLEGIDAAATAGFAPIKINMVVRRGINEHQIVPMAKRFAQAPFILRFIEYMDVGNSNHWRLDEVVPAAEILARLAAEAPLEEIPPQVSGETARRYRLRGFSGEIGVIASVTRPFCQGCSRARISAQGLLHTCLFGRPCLDLRALLRAPQPPDREALRQTIVSAWQAREDRYSELRGRLLEETPKTEMSLLGG